MQDLQGRLRAQLQRIPFQRIVALSTHPRFATVTAGLVGSLAVLLLLNFLVVNWYSFEPADFAQPGIGIVIGAGDGPFGRAIDILLVIVPFAALTQIVLAGLVIRHMLPLSYGLLNMVVVAFLLLMVPFVWQALSTNAFDANVRDDLRTGYNTASYFWLSLLMLLAAMISSLMFFTHQLNLFAVNEEAAKTPLPSAEPETLSTDGGVSS